MKDGEYSCLGWVAGNLKNREMRGHAKVTQEVFVKAGSKYTSWESYGAQYRLVLNLSTLSNSVQSSKTIIAYSVRTISLKKINMYFVYNS